MASETEITVRGRLGQNPEIQRAAGKKSWLRLRVATNRRIRNGETWVDGPTSWYDVKLWGDFAENVAESLRKGDAVIVQGELSIEEYTNTNNITFRTPVIHAQALGPDLRSVVARPMRVNRVPELPPVDVSGMAELPSGMPVAEAEAPDEDEELEDEVEDSEPALVG